MGPASVPVTAQDSGEDGGGEIPIESDWPAFMPETYSQGDKFFGISVGPVFPLFFTGKDGPLEKNINIGGGGFLSYNYFLNGHVFLGGEIGIAFASTVAEASFMIVPMGMRAGYQFILGRFEIPLSLLVGFAPEKYLEQDYFGLFLKPSASFFWRFNPDWSFGLNAAWWWVPQWPTDGKDAYGNFLEISLSARYHF
jgi:hypothetical protein